MIKPKRLIQMARKWRNVDAVTGGNKKLGKNIVVKVNVAEKGHFVVYTIDKRRFVVPLKYLQADVFKELFRMSEEVFGLPVNGPITLPCDALFMEFVVSTLFRRQDVCKDLEKALLIPLSSCSTSAGLCCSSSISLPTGRDQSTQQLLLHGF